MAPEGSLVRPITYFGDKKSPRPLLPEKLRAVERLSPERRPLLPKG